MLSATGEFAEIILDAWSETEYQYNHIDGFRVVNSKEYYVSCEYRRLNPNDAGQGSLGRIITSVF